METPDIITKCAEIHYQKGKWRYLCIFCGLIAHKHRDIRNHLKLNHFSELKCKEAPSLNRDTPSQQKSEKTKQDDPLEWSPIEEEYENNSIATDAETRLEDVTQDIDDDSNMPYDYEVLYDSEEDQSREDMQIEDSQTYDESNVEPENVSSNDSQNGSEIDWNTPFDPKYYKDREKRPYRARKMPHTCTFCGRTYLTRYQFDAHLNMHTGDKPYQCEICGRQFRAVATLKNHLITHEKRFFTCKYCNKCFSRKPALTNHERHHNQERNESCDLCGKRFTTVNRLDTHKRRIHKILNTELPFACDLCPKRYRAISMLSTHRSKIHCKFQCEKCEKKFVNNQGLEEHKKLHVDGNKLTHYRNLTNKT